MRTEQSAMLADEETDIARDSGISTGEVEFVLARGRDHWNCSCEKYAGKVWKVDDPERPSIPVHPNCACEWRARLKTDAELLAEFEKRNEVEMRESAEPAAEYQEPVSGSAPEYDDETSGEDEWDFDDKSTNVPGFARREPTLEKLFNVKQGKPKTINQALETTNPHYNENIAYRENCPFAVAAFEANRNGYSMEAQPMPSDRKRAAFNSAFTAFVDMAGKPLANSAERASEGRANLEKRLKEFPDGARFVVKINFDKSTIGHEFIAEKVNGKIRYIEAQNEGKKNAAYRLEQARTDDDGRKSIFFARLDTARFNPDIRWREAFKFIGDEGIDKLVKNARIYAEVTKMTIKEARAILENAEELKPHIVPGEHEMGYFPIGGFLQEFSNGFAFAVYPYGEGKKPNPKYALEFFVDKADGSISQASGPLHPDDAQAMYDKYLKDQ